MADLNELFKKASDKKSVPISTTKRSFGLKETMASIKNDPTITKSEDKTDQTLGSREVGVRQTLGENLAVRQALSGRELAVSQTLGAQSSLDTVDKSDQPISKPDSVKHSESERAAEVKSQEMNVEIPITNVKTESTRREIKVSDSFSETETKSEIHQPLGRRKVDVRQALGEVDLAQSITAPLQTAAEVKEIIPRESEAAPVSAVRSELVTQQADVVALGEGGLNPQTQRNSSTPDFLISSISTTSGDQPLGRREADASQALGGREAAVSQALGENKSAVRQPLGKTTPTEQPLGKPLGRRETAVSPTLGVALGSREAAVRLIDQFKTLVGNERELTEIVFFEAKKTGTHTTDAIKSDLLCSYFNMNSTSLRNLVDRVKKKNILTCTSTVGGHSSVRIFTLSAVVYHHLMQQALGGREVAVRWALGEPLGRRETDVSQTLGFAPRKEVSINNKYLTNLAEEIINEPTELIDAMFNAGALDYEHTRTFMEDFNYWPKYLADLKRNLSSKGKTITTGDLQNLLDRFPEYLQFSISSGQPIKRAGPFFIKEAMNFAEEGDCTLSLFKTKAEIQKDEMIKQLRQKALDEKKKLSEEMELIKLGAFKEWIESMTEEEQKNLAAPMNNSKMLIMSSLRAKFESGVWQAKQKELGLI